MYDTVFVNFCAVCIEISLEHAYFGNLDEGWTRKTVLIPSTNQFSPSSAFIGHQKKKKNPKYKNKNI